MEPHGREGLAVVERSDSEAVAVVECRGKVQGALVDRYFCQVGVTKETLLVALVPCFLWGFFYLN